MKVAIIDDDLGVVEALQAALDLWGYHSQGIHNLNQLAAELTQLQPDLIFLDWLLSGTDGIQVAQQIRQTPHFSHTPIILMSAHPNAAAIAEQIAVDGFLPKPFSLDRLRQLLAEVPLQRPD